MKPHQRRPQKSTWEWTAAAVLFSACLFSLYWNTFVYLPKLATYQLFWGNHYLSYDYGEKVKEAAAFHPEIRTDSFLLYAYEGLLKAVREHPSISSAYVRTTVDEWDPFLSSNPYVVVWPGKIHAALWLKEHDGYDYETAIYYFNKALSVTAKYPVALYDLHALYYLNGDPRAEEMQRKIESLWGPMTEQQKATII